MPDFVVHVRTSTTRLQAQTFTAESEEDARVLAEETDWAEWPDEEKQVVDTYIDWIEVK